MARHRPLSLDFLRSFEAVARRLSFSGAADELHLTQPAISRQIKAIEEELGAPLFTRGTRRVELTSAGHQLLRAVQPALARLDTTVRQIRLARGRAQVSVSTYATFATLWLMPRLAEFEREHPSIDLRLSASDRLLDTDEPDIDFLLRSCPPDLAGAGALRLFGEVLTPVIGARLHDAIERGEVPPLREPADLEAHTLLEVDDGPSPQSAIFSWSPWLATRGLATLVPRRWMSTNYAHQQVQLALAGQGVALAKLALVHDALERGELHEPFGLDGRTTHRHAYWLVPTRSGNEAIERPELMAFRQWVLDHARVTSAVVDGPVEADGLGEQD